MITTRAPDGANKQNEQELDQIVQERSASWIWETGMRDMGGGHIKVAFNVLEHPDFKDIAYVFVALYLCWVFKPLCLFFVFVITVI